MVTVLGGHISSVAHDPVYCVCMLCMYLQCGLHVQGYPVHLCPLILELTDYLPAGDHGYSEADILVLKTSAAMASHDTSTP